MSTEEIQEQEPKKSQAIKWEEPKTKPFLKWAGGKIKIVPTLKRKFPKNGKRFIEPFVGAGSVSLNVDYPSYIINDTNSDLISVWQELKSRGPLFISECEELFIPKNNVREIFDELKQEFNQTKNKARKAILFVYLNRHCFNGLCRYNGSGRYNVPFGRYDEPYFPRKEFEGCLEKIKQFKMFSEDFREIFGMVEEGDVVYCDPPYFPSSETANFDGYASGGFSLRDHVDLAELAEKSAQKGATVIISNHCNWYSRQLYTEFCKGKVSTLEVARTISSKTDERDSVKEIIAVFANND